MPVEIHPEYLNDISKAEESGQDNDPSGQHHEDTAVIGRNRLESAEGGTDRKEASAADTAEIDREMQELDAKYPHMLNFRPEAALGFEANGIMTELERLQAERESLEKAPMSDDKVMIGTLEQIQQRHQDARQQELASLDQGIESLQIELAIRKDAINGLQEKGRDPFADRYFANKAQQAQEWLRAATMAENSLKRQPIDANDSGAFASRAEEIKKAEKTTGDAARRLRLAVDQRAYLDLMAKKKPL